MSVAPAISHIKRFNTTTKDQALVLCLAVNPSPSNGNDRIRDPDRNFRIVADQGRATTL